MIIKPVQKYDSVESVKSKRKNSDKDKDSDSGFESLLDDIDIVEISTKHQLTDDQKKQNNENDKNSKKQNSETKKLDRFV